MGVGIGVGIIALFGLAQTIFLFIALECWNLGRIPEVEYC